MSTPNFLNEPCGGYNHGIRHNLSQFVHQLIQVLLVGLTIGMMRNVIPALAESEFGVPRGSFLLLMAFVVAFGFVKGVLNFLAGRLSERIGRKQVLLIGWLSAVPIPFMILYAPSWNWIIAATVMLGVNQGFTWSMTQTAKLDITRSDQRGLTIGLNEFFGYLGVAVAGVVTGHMAKAYGARMGLFVFGVVAIALAIGIYRFWRDLGYGIGALAVGLVAKASGAIEAGFWLVFVAMLLSGAILWWLGEETHPGLNPATADS
ncbi:MAG: MFS transporter [Betaproteobacteria bacterium]|nr:MFS transporter [Betaproteobacteria bacterium]